jgi:hypothetical protein
MLLASVRGMHMMERQWLRLSGLRLRRGRRMVLLLLVCVCCLWQVVMRIAPLPSLPPPPLRCRM